MKREWESGRLEKDSKEREANNQYKKKYEELECDYIKQQEEAEEQILNLE